MNTQTDIQAVEVINVEMALEPKYLVVNYFEASDTVLVSRVYYEKSLKDFMTENTRLIINLI